MTRTQIKRAIHTYARLSCTPDQYKDFLLDAFHLICQHENYLSPIEDINSLELAHLIPEVPETVLAIYIAINDAVCNKALVSSILPRHGHNNVFVFNPAVYPGGEQVPSGTVDARSILVGFEPPNESWNPDWTYVMIQDPDRSYASLWQERGYIDMIPAKFEDFTQLTDFNTSKLCIFISSKAFEHPVNQSRPYLKAARERGQKWAHQFMIPPAIQDEFDELEPVILDQGEKLYVATKDFGPCAHGWSNCHPDNLQLAVVNENSAVPLDLVIAKPPADPQFATGLIPPRGSADMTTDWFLRGRQIMRKPLLEGLFKG